MNTNVHSEHCCIIHGCKYVDENCPVEKGLQKQSYPCEVCGDDKTSYKHEWGKMNGCETCDVIDEPQYCFHCPQNPSVGKELSQDMVGILLLKKRSGKDVCRIWNNEMESELQYKGDGIYVEVHNL